MSNVCATHKKRRERFLLERFLETAGIAAQVVEEREAPDFLINTDDGLIGVEVSELFISHETHGNTPQAQEAISAQIAAKAQRLYQESGGSPAHVSLCFAPGRDLRHLNRDDTAHQLSNLVREMNLVPWQRINWRPYEPHAALPSEIAFVYALGVPDSKMAHWNVARAGWVAPLTLGPLQQRIDAKVKRLPIYRDSIQENWLLIVADAMKPSALIEVRHDFDPLALASTFSRTFFYRHPHDFIELGVAK